MTTLSTAPVRLSGYVCALLTVSFAILLSFPPAVRAATPNPPWQQHCPQRIVLLVDLSESMEPNLDVVRQSSRALIDALRGAPNEVAVIALGTNAVVAVPVTDVGADEPRQELKAQIDDLNLLEGVLGATNWEAAFTAAGSLRPDAVVLLTDGQPTAHGTPAVGGSGTLDPEHLNSAVRAADALKSDGTRIIGLGMGLPPENVGNLAAVTGPAAGDDFYQTDASGLLGRLYEIAGKACGVPVAMLPQPEPGTFPLAPVLGAGVVAVLAIVGGGLALSRRRGAGSAEPHPVTRLPARPLPDPTIALDDLPPVSSTMSADQDPDPHRPGHSGVVAPPSGQQRREPRRISLAQFHDADPPHDKGRGGGAGESGQQL